MAVSPSISSWSLLQPSPLQAQILVLPEWLLHLCLQPQGCSWTGRLSLLSPQWEASLHIRDEKEKAGFWRQHWGDRDKMGTENWISASWTSGLSFHHWGSTLCLLTLLSTSIFILEIQSIPHFLIFFFADSISTNLPNSCPLSQWCHPTISSSVIPFSSCPQSFPASGCFPVSQLFTSCGQNIEAWA